MIREVFDSVRLAKRLGEFDYVRLPNPIQINRTTEVRLSSITERSSGYAGIFVLYRETNCISSFQSSLLAPLGKKTWEYTWSLTWRGVSSAWSLRGMYPGRDHDGTRASFIRF